MRTADLIFVSVCAVASSAFGATVDFDPPQTSVQVGGVAEFSVTIASTEFAGFDTFDLLFSSDVGGLGLTFEYEQTLAAEFTVFDPVAVAIFASDLYISGSNPGFWQAPLVVGTLRIDTTGLDPAQYPDIIMVRPDAEAAIAPPAISNVGNLGAREDINGAVSIIVGDIMPDSDGDGVADIDDAFPLDPVETTDTDADGIGNVADPDDDNDGVSDVDDAFPLDPTETADSDGDGIGDNADVDDSNGGTEPQASSSFCGAGAVGAIFITMLGLATLRFTSRLTTRTRNDR